MRKMRAALAAALLTLSAAAWAPPAAAVDPDPCAGYPGPTRAFLDWQAWWSDPGDAWPGRHAHVGACWPVNDVPVNGPTSFDLKVQTHAQPPGAVVTRIRMTDHCSGSGCSWDPATSTRKSSGHNVFVHPKPLPQPDANGDLALSVPLTLDLSKFGAGRHEFRFGVYVTQPDGVVQLVSSRAQICIRSCSPAFRSLTQFPKLQGTGGWYANDSPIGYADARITSLIPTAPVSNWTLTGQCQDPSGAPITKTTVALDMNAHAGDRGTVLFASNGPSKFSLNIAIPPGTHRVAIVCDAKSPSSSIPGVNSGVIVATIRGG